MSNLAVKKDSDDKQKTEKKKAVAKQPEEDSGKNEKKPKETKKSAEKKTAKKAARVEEKKPLKAGKETEKPASDRAGKKPERKWIELKPAEIEEAIISLANAGHTASEIGMILRDQYGVPKVKTATKKTVSLILKHHNLLGEIPEDLLNLIRKSVRLKTHLQKNRKDMSAKRGYQLAVSRVRRLASYYTENNRLPKGWRFSEQEAELLVK